MAGRKQVPYHLPQIPCLEDVAMLSIWTAIQSRLDGEEGAAIVEYVFLVVLIAVVVVAGATALGEKVSTNFDNVSSRF